MTKSKGKILIYDKVIKKWIREIKKLYQKISKTFPHGSLKKYKQTIQKTKRKKKQMTNEHFKFELATNKRKQYFPVGVEKLKDWVISHT